MKRINENLIAKNDLIFFFFYKNTHIQFKQITCKHKHLCELLLLNQEPNEANDEGDDDDGIAFEGFA